MAEPPPEMRKKISVSFFAFFNMCSVARAAANDSSLGKRMAALKIAETPVALLGQVFRATDAAQSLAPLHAVQQHFQHRPGSLAQGNDKDALVLREIDGVWTAAIGDQAAQRVSAQSAAACRRPSRCCRLRARR